MDKFEKSVELMDERINELKNRNDAPISEYIFLAEYVKKHKKVILQNVANHPTANQYEAAYNFVHGLFMKSRLSNLTTKDINRIVSKVLGVHSFLELVIRTYIILLFLITAILYYATPYVGDDKIFLCIGASFIASMVVTFFAAMFVYVLDLRIRFFIVKG